MLLDDLDRTFEIESVADAEEVSDITLDRRSRTAEPVAEEKPNADAAAALPDDAPADLVEAAERLIEAGYRISRADDDADGVSGRENNGDDVADGEDIPALSPRELEVLALLAEGAPNKVIARRLDISVHTAKFHVASLIAKLGAVNRTDATAIAMRQGLVAG